MRIKFAMLTLALALTAFCVAKPSFAACTLVDNFCSSCAGGKVRSCDRYRCWDDLSGKYVYYNTCTSCANFC